MNTFKKLSAIAFMLSAMAACTSETGQDATNPPIGGDGTDAQHREVLLTLKNKLLIPQSTKSDGNTATKAGDAIATAAENTLSTLDVYVFASDREDGPYTYQERFAYHADGSVLPTGATEIDLSASADTEAKGLLALKKGLYVKLYCIANQSSLVDPANPTAVIPDTYFEPLKMTQNGKVMQVTAAGVPSEADFLTFHTPLLDATKPADILNTPLAMAGAYTTALDLTDFETSARMQVGFKLTRLTSRFDVVNDASKSKFTIQSISMANGRRGAGFFPIRVYGTQPVALDGELITYPLRTISADTQQPEDPSATPAPTTSLTRGAFYTYPSPTKDEGYIILKGTYAVNQTESKEVSYSIPFKSANDADGNFLEINNNHRYTIAITNADLYHLDFTLKVSDWADDGSVDDYLPGDGSDAEATVDVTPDPSGETTYDPDTRTVTMPIRANTEFSLTAGAAYKLEKTYAGGPSAQQYDWLAVAEEEVEITKATTVAGKKYTFTVTPGYDLEYPVAVLRFTNPTSGDNFAFRVDPMAGTSPEITSGATYTLAALANTEVPYIDITVKSIGGCIITGPEWLTYDKESTTTELSTFRVSLKPDKANFPTELPSDQTITIKNRKKPELSDDVTVSFTDMPRVIVANADANETDGSYRVKTAGKTITVSIASMFQPTTVTSAMDAGFGDGNNWLPQPSGPTYSEIKNNRRIYTCEIVIPASSGTDADYQLHKGTVTAKVGNGTEAIATIWRGASNIPYPTKGFDNTEGGSPYYSAVQLGSYWWAPLNLGAYEIAANAIDRKYVGNFYQWGRKVSTYYGSTATTSGPVSDENAIDEFITGNEEPFNWLNPKNDNLWDNGTGKDPCPTGWHVPNNTDMTPWLGTHNLTAGVVTIPGENNINLVLPLGGTRNRGTGNSSRQGDEGGYWTKTAAGNFSYAFYANSQIDYVLVNQTTSTWRATGMSVRCVKE